MTYELTQRTKLVGMGLGIGGQEIEVSFRLTNTLSAMRTNVPTMH